MKKIAPLCISLVSSATMAAQTAVRINQVGYFPEQEKVAIVENNDFKTFKVLDSNNRIVLTGKCSGSAKSSFSDKTGYRADFSSITRPGRYTLMTGGTRTPFIVKDKAYEELAKAAIKAFYYQRTAMPIEQQYAGKWSRPAAHPDTEVIVHPSAASASRPAGTVISSPKGWYDAGDFNKYIVNSAFTIGQILGAYPLCENIFKRLSLNIPESGNGAPDVLDEMHYNLEWMFTMQDPDDGGLYHKLTTPNFESFIMPAECRQKRYVVQKSTCATLDFAACMAMAARVYAPYDSQFPGFCQKAIDASEKAYEWALKNPDVLYNQNKINQDYDPDVATGTYGDFNTGDEFFWAATELYLTTGNAKYRMKAIEMMPKEMSVPTWGQVAPLGLLSWLYPSSKRDDGYTYSKGALHGGNLKQDDRDLADNIARMLDKWCEAYINNVENTMYLSPFGNKKSDFHWASIAEGTGTESELLLMAYKQSGKKEYLINALRNADYMLGRNATGYCFVTGFGTKSPMNPHHRISFADGIKEPIPGLLVGGPNAHPSDGVEYPSSSPEESYADNKDSYTTNEIAINWNAALVALSAMLESIME